MPTDKMLLQQTLKMLASFRGTPVSESVLGDYVENGLHRAITTQNLRGALDYCKDRGWVDHRINDLREDTWWITDAGRARLSEMW